MTTEVGEERKKKIYTKRKIRRRKEKTTSALYKRHHSPLPSITILFTCHVGSIFKNTIKMQQGTTDCCCVRIICPVILKFHTHAHIYKKCRTQNPRQCGVGVVVVPAYSFVLVVP
jgi:hypothetical protein